MNRTDYEKTSSELRGVMDSNDPFLAGGHRIISPRRGNKMVPLWAESYEQMRKVLLRAFPKLGTDIKQRQQAARWARVIYLHFRVQMTYGQILLELGRELPDGRVIPMKMTTLRSLIRSIRRVAGNKPADGRLVRSQRGRPRKFMPQPTHLLGTDETSGTVPANVDGAGSTLTY